MFSLKNLKRKPKTKKTINPKKKTCPQAVRVDPPEPYGWRDQRYNTYCVTGAIELPSVDDYTGWTRSCIYNAQMQESRGLTYFNFPENSRTYECDWEKNIKK